MMMMTRMFLKASHTEQTSLLNPLIRSIAAAMSYSSAVKPLPPPRAAADTSSSSAPACHIVCTKASADMNYPIRTLSAVLGSEEAAKEAMVYNYEDGINDHFSAVLTPQNVVQLLKQPGVIHVIRSRVTQIKRVGRP